MSIRKYRENIERSFHTFAKSKFLLEELVKRDFKKKYKRTALGMLWSILSPLLSLLVMRVVFTRFFGSQMAHYTTYLFAGNIIMSYYREATSNGMRSLYENANVISKINIPKYLFLFSSNVTALVNFLLTFVVFILFCFMDHITFGWHMLALIYPTICLTIMNIGIGMILSCIFIFFRDTVYLYDVFLTLLTYVSAIFYDISQFSAHIQQLFLLNPVFVFIKYFRTVVIAGTIPSLSYHLLMAGYAFFFLAIGFHMYRKYNHQFIYYF